MSAEVEAALDRIAAMERPADLELGERYDGLAEVAADDGDLELAVRAERRALELGCREPDLARQMLGWYLLEGGDREEGEATFAAARAERRECREDLGLPPDEDDLLARRDDPELPDAAACTVAWFPRGRSVPRWSAGPRLPGT